jgi:tRNA modification GTPase
MISPAETIAAIATPVGRGGIGIIRISGPRSAHIAGAIFRSKKGVRSFESHRLYLGHIREPGTKGVLDEVLLSYMKAPHSYTAEDVVEINSHSGHFLLSKILQIILDQGARLAHPGEFTLRAFLNGRIDLPQAEAVVDLIHAQSERGLQLASEQIEGSLTREIKSLKKNAVECLALAEAMIDYPEEMRGQSIEKEIIRGLETGLLTGVRALVEAHERKRVWIDGVKTVIIGRVNAGKSSLLNRLLREERAIVTPIPGTTRDIIESSINLAGIPLRLTDTAGFREAKDEVEAAGISLTEKKLADADLLILVMDRSLPVEQEDLALLQRMVGRKAILVINKIDLDPHLPAETYQAWGLPHVEVSALTGEGMDGLVAAIKDAILSSDLDMIESHVAPNLRHHKGLLAAEGFFREALREIREGMPMEIVAMEIKTGLDALDEILGESTGDGVIESIFSRFCLGK